MNTTALKLNPGTVFSYNADSSRLLNLKESTFIQRVISVFSKGKPEPVPPAYTNALKMLDQFFSNVYLDDPPHVTFKRLQNHKFNLTFRTAFQHDNPRILLLTFNYELLKENGTRVEIVSTPDDEKVALETQLVVKYLLNGAGYHAPLILNPNDMARSKNPSINLLFREERKNLQGETGKQKILRDVDGLIRSYYKNMKFYDRKEIGRGMDWINLHKMSFTDIQQETARETKRLEHSQDIKQIIAGIGGGWNELKNVPQDEIDFMLKKFNKFYNGEASLVFTESVYKNSAYKLAKMLTSKKDGESPVFQLPADWEVMTDNGNVFLGRSSDTYRVQIAHMGEDGTYNPFCPIRVAIALKDFQANLGGTHVMAVLNREEAKRVSEYAYITQNVFGMSQELKYAIGGITPTHELKVYLKRHLS
jgi:hypothetical protein